MIRLRNLLLSQCVHAPRHFLGLRPVVDEHERGSRCTDVLEHEWCYCRPDTSPDIREIRHRRLDRNLHLLREPAVHHSYLSILGLPVFGEMTSAQITCDFVQRTLRCRKADALRRLSRKRFESL